MHFLCLLRLFRYGGLISLTHVYSSSLEHKPLKIVSSLVETRSGTDKTLTGSPVTEVVCLKRMCMSNTVNFCQENAAVLSPSYEELTVERNINIKKEFLECGVRV
jgi:hypothetical protein